MNEFRTDGAMRASRDAVTRPSSSSTLAKRVGLVIADLGANGIPNQLQHRWHVRHCRPIPQLAQLRAQSDESPADDQHVVRQH
jgi:hypothetical protein